MPIVVIPSGTGAIVTPQLVVSYNNPTKPTLGYIYVSQNERWDTIAWKMYGDPTLVSALAQWNPGVPLVDTIPAGTPLFIPLIVPNTPQTTSTPWG